MTETFRVGRTHFSNHTEVPPGTRLRVRSKTISWVVSVCAVYIRLSQAKTLGVLIAAAMRSQRISLANLGRQMTGNVKHQVKRAWRFCANDGVEVSDAMRGVVDRLVKKRKKPLLVALDWVDLKGYTVKDWRVI